MIKKSYLVFFLVVVLVGVTCDGACGTEEKRANVFFSSVIQNGNLVGQPRIIVVEDKVIELVDYRKMYGKYEVTLKIDNKKHVLKEGESLDVGFEITFLEKTEDLAGLAFYISAIPYFDELNEVRIGEGESVLINGHRILFYATPATYDFKVINAEISFDGKGFIFPQYSKVESGDLELWFVGRGVFKYRYLYRDIEGNSFPENVFRIPKTKEANCIVVVGRDAAEEDHETANKIAESLNCDVLYDDQIEESHKKNYNLISVGGPCPPCGKNNPANKITYELVEKGVSQKEYWITGRGSKEGFTYFKDPWGYEKDVVVVAGSDREFTYATGENLIEILSKQ